MASFNLLLLPGDGIGPEVMGEVKKVVNFLGKQGVASFETETDLVGGSAYDAHKVAITDAAMKSAQPPMPCCSARSAGPNGTRFPTMRGPRPACCGCARISACSPIYAPPSAIRRWPTPRR